MSRKRTPELPARPLLPRLSLAVQYATASKEVPTRTQLRRWIKAALQRDVLMTLRIVDEEEGRELNRGYRRRNYSTNVLTFVYDDAGPAPPLTRRGREGSGRPGEAACSQLHGDVVICAPVVEREAREQRKDLLSHYAHLAIHAALHLQGYDHENDADAEAMEALETAIMLKLRRPDPYQDSRIAHGRARK